MGCNASKKRKPALSPSKQAKPKSQNVEEPKPVKVYQEFKQNLETFYNISPNSVFPKTYRCLTLIRDPSEQRVYQVVPQVNDLKVPIKERLQQILEIEHPNLLKLYEVYEYGDEYQLVWDSFQGISEKNYHFFGREACVSEIGRQIFRALDHLHTQNIVHGNIDSESFIFYHQNCVKLIGYGHGFRIKSDTKSKLSQMSTQYLAPEIVNRKVPPSTATDIWACGILLFYLMTGKFLFRGLAEKDVLSNIGKGAFNLKDYDLSDRCRQFFEEVFHFTPFDRQCAKKFLDHNWLKKNHKISAQTLHSLMHQKHEMKHQDQKIQKSLTLDDQRTISINYGEQVDPNLQVIERQDKNSYAYLMSQLYYSFDKERILRAFEHLDTENKGIITRVDILRQASRHHKAEDAEKFADKVLHHFNKQPNDYFTAQDFINYFVDDTICLNDANALKAFKELDYREQQLVTMDDFSRISNYYEADIQKFSWIFNREDRDKKGSINFGQFKRMLKTARRVYIVEKSNLKKSELASSNTILSPNPSFSMKTKQQPSIPSLKSVMIEKNLIQSTNDQKSKKFSYQVQKVAEQLIINELHSLEAMVSPAFKTSNDKQTTQGLQTQPDQVDITKREETVADELNYENKRKYNLNELVSLNISDRGQVSQFNGIPLDKSQELKNKKNLKLIVNNEQDDSKSLEKKSASISKSCDKSAKQGKRFLEIQGVEYEIEEKVFQKRTPQMREVNRRVGSEVPKADERSLKKRPFRIEGTPKNLRLTEKTQGLLKKVQRRTRDFQTFAETQTVKNPVNFNSEVQPRIDTEPNESVLITPIKRPTRLRSTMQSKSRAQF